MVPDTALVMYVKRNFMKLNYRISPNNVVLTVSCVLQGNTGRPGPPGPTGPQGHGVQGAKVGYDLMFFIFR